MSEFEFELIFKLEHEENPEKYLDSLYEAGCDDALIGIASIGYISLNFTTEANSAFDAIVGAYKKVLKTIPHARLERAEPDLLNVTELAYEFGYTKQNMRKYVRGEMATINNEFPSPAVSGKTSYWHVAEISTWLEKYANMDISIDRQNTFNCIWGLNQAIENRRLSNNTLTKSFESMLVNVA